MKKSRSFKVLAVALISFCCSPATDKTTATDSATTVTETVKGGDALPSWNDGDVKKRLTDFVINAKGRRQQLYTGSRPHCRF